MPNHRYLVILRSSAVTPNPPSAGPKPDMYAAFKAWQEKFSADIVDMGGRLRPGGRVVTTAGVTDGPFAEAKEVVGGFMIVAAPDYESAVQIARECPGVVSAATSAEIREIANA